MKEKRIWNQGEKDIEWERKEFGMKEKRTLNEKERIRNEGEINIELKRNEKEFRRNEH